MPGGKGEGGWQGRGEPAVAALFKGSALRGTLGVPFTGRGAPAIQLPCAPVHIGPGGIPPLFWRPWWAAFFCLSQDGGVQKRGLFSGGEVGCMCAFQRGKGKPAHFSVGRGCLPRREGVSVVSGGRGAVARGRGEVYPFAQQGEGGPLYMIGRRGIRLPRTKGERHLLRSAGRGPTAHGWEGVRSFAQQGEGEALCTVGGKVSVCRAGRGRGIGCARQGVWARRTRQGRGAPVCPTEGRGTLCTEGERYLLCPEGRGGPPRAHERRKGYLPCLAGRGGACHPRRREKSDHCFRRG